MNQLLLSGKKEVNIIIYGKNCNDNTLYTKYQQLISLGFYNVYVYPGGLFEWLILQDIYGHDDFPTTKKELDFLRFKPNKILNIALQETDPEDKSSYYALLQKYAIKKRSKIQTN